MKARPPRPLAEDVRGLMAELGDLVEDLGLETAHTAPSGPAPALAETAEVAGVVAPREAASPVETPAAIEELVAVPMWEAAEAPAAPAPAWETLVPQRSDEAPRAWSPSAATVVIEPAAPPPGHRIVVRRPVRERRLHAFTVVTALAVLVAAAVFTFSRLDLGHTSGPSVPVSHTQFELDQLRTVQASSAARVAGAPSVHRFLSTVPAIYLDVTYRNATPGDALRVVILLQPQRGDQPASTVSDQTHTGLDPGGEIALTIQAPPGGFAPGTYTVRALYGDHLEQTATFEVDQPA
jgi:hypothetical protein